MKEGTLSSSSVGRLRGDARLLAPMAPQWTEALQRINHDIYHLPEYVALDAQVSGGTGMAFLYREPTYSFLLPLIFRDVPDTGMLDVISPYGYPGPVSDADPADTRFWRRACRSLVATLSSYGVVTAFIRLHPLLPAPLDVLRRAGTVVYHGETVSADLSLTEDEMWSQTRRDHRNHINRARRAGVQVVMDRWDLLDKWIAVYHDNMRRLGASEFYFFPAEHVIAVHRALGDRLHLATALVDGEVVGGNTFFEYRGICQGYISSTRRAHNFYADKLLYDEVRRWTKHRGNAVFHFGGGVGGENDSLFSYKAGFAGGRHPFHTWRIVADPAVYNALLRRKGLRPDAGRLSGHFPAYR
jgi:Acetyltransferase (GNAT) domain